MSGPDDGSEAGWERLSALLDEALDLADARERAAWLEDLAEREPATARGVSELLAAALTDSPQIDDPSGGGRYVALVPAEAGESASRAGAEVGGWRLLERIGRGGMGEVYLAERTGADFRQRAAVKLLAPEAQHPELRSRFARERRILAALAHDGIARFLDGGIAADGTPFLALEYVEGEPLLAWCRNRRAPGRPAPQGLRRRLRRRRARPLQPRRSSRPEAVERARGPRREESSCSTSASPRSSSPRSIRSRSPALRASARSSAR